MSWNRWQPFERRMERAIRKLAPGTLGGTLESAAPPITATHVLRTYEPASASAAPDEIVFSHSGGLLATTSPRWYARRNLTITKVFGSLGTTGTSTTTVNVRRNGTTVATLSFGSGVATASDDTITTPGLTADTDYLTVEVATVGTGNPADLDVQVRYV